MQLQARAQIPDTRKPRGVARRYGDIDRRQRVLNQAEGLSRQTLDAVADDGVAAGARRDREPEPRIRFMVCQNRQAKIGVGKSSAALPCSAKFGRLVQTLARLERQFTDWDSLTGLTSGAEALAALRTAPRKQPPAAFGGHTCAKPVGTGTMQITRVEGTFHSANLEKNRGAKQRSRDICERRQGY
jgi:hypothetical protein